MLEKKLAYRLFLLFRGLRTSGRKSDVGLERVIEEPLETSESTNHNNTDRETIPETTETNLAVDTANSSTDRLTRLLLSVNLRNHNISGVRNNSAENTSNVTTKEGNTSLSKKRVLLLGERKGLVDLFNSLFESSKLNHGVRNLTSPERRKTLVKTTETFSSSQLLVTIENGGGERRDSGLSLDFNGFPRTEESISNEFSRGRGSEVNGSVVVLSKLRASKVRVGLLEEFVETVLTGTLERVTDKSGTETSEDTTGTLSGNDGLPSLNVRGVKTGVYLSSALDKIKRSDSSVCRTASYNNDKCLVRDNYSSKSI